ncbi:MAG: MFS transporter, partial [Chlamydiia bacterium]|nr:MFS transporter [Chlamydiia bacterium]
MKSHSKLELLPIYFVLFIDNFGFAIIFATFGSLFIDPSYGFISSATPPVMRNIMLGVALALFPLGQFVGAPFLGDIADHFGRKRAFYITILGGVLGFLLSGLAIFLHSYTLLILTRLLTGFFSGNLSICLASIADLSPDEKTRAKNFSIIIITTGLSWMIAMLTGGYLSNPNLSKHFNPALPFFVTALLSFISFLTILVFYKETHAGEKKIHFNL